MKVFLYGKRGAGKSTLIKRLLNELGLKHSGFYTIRGPVDAEGEWDVYIASADNVTNDARDKIAHCRVDGSWESYSEVFNNTGVRLLTFIEKPEIIVMDELGFMEAQAEKFKNRVFEILGGEVPVIGVVKQRPEPFLQSIFSHPSVRTIEVTEENRDGVYTELKGIFSGIRRAGNDL